WGGWHVGRGLWVRRRRRRLPLSRRSHGRNAVSIPSGVGPLAVSRRGGDAGSPPPPLRYPHPPPPRHPHPPPPRHPPPPPRAAALAPRPSPPIPFFFDFAAESAKKSVSRGVIGAQTCTSLLISAGSWSSPSPSGARSPDARAKTPVTTTMIRASRATTSTKSTARP